MKSCGRRPRLNPPRSEPDAMPWRIQATDRLNPDERQSLGRIASRRFPAASASEIRWAARAVGASAMAFSLCGWKGTQLASYVGGRDAPGNMRWRAGAFRRPRRRKDEPGPSRKGAMPAPPSAKRSTSSRASKGWISRCYSVTPICCASTDALASSAMPGKPWRSKTARTTVFRWHEAMLGTGPQTRPGAPCPGSSRAALVSRPSAA